jgi:nucleoside-diphosphate-sugar epimerase
MRILVSGGAGFIGSHTADALVASGAHRVSVLDYVALRYANVYGPRPDFRLLQGAGG